MEKNLLVSKWPPGVIVNLVHFWNLIKSKINSGIWNIYIYFNYHNFSWFKHSKNIGKHDICTDSKNKTFIFFKFGCIKAVLSTVMSNYRPLLTDISFSCSLFLTALLVVMRALKYHRPELHSVLREQREPLIMAAVAAVVHTRYHEITRATAEGRASLIQTSRSGGLMKYLAYWDTVPELIYVEFDANPGSCSLFGLIYNKNASIFMCLMLFENGRNFIHVHTENCFRDSRNILLQTWGTIRVKILVVKLKWNE